MAGTFAEFVAWPDRAEVVVAELSAMLTDVGGVTLTGWTATAGNANTWDRALTNQTDAVGTLGRLYRRVTGVRENGVELTARTSIALVNANAGSWFWDEAAGRLYVRTTGTAVDPDTRASVAARVTFYLASAPIVVDRVDGDPASGFYCDPRLTAQTAPTHVDERADVLTGQKTTYGGDLVAGNGDGAFFPLVAVGAGYTWKGQRAVVRLGGTYRGQTLAWSAFEAVGAMVIEDVTADEVEARFALRPVTALADVAIPKTPYFDAEYPALGDGVRGTYKPIIYGRNWVRPALTSTAGAGTWTVADAAYQDLYAVHVVEAVDRASGAIAWLSPGLDYTANLATCTITILSDRFSHLTHEIRADVTGKTTITGGAVGMRGYLSTFAEIAEDLLRTFAGVTTAEIDAAGFAEAHADARQELAVALTSPRALTGILATAEEGLASLERSAHGTIQQTRAGLWTARVWDPVVDTTTIPALTREDLASFSASPRMERTYTAIRVLYAYDGRSDTWAAREVINDAQRYLTGSLDRRDLYTFLRHPGDAEVMARRYDAVNVSGSLAIDFVERGTLLALSSVGDRVLVTYAPAPHVSGEYVARVMTLDRLERGYGPKMTLHGAMTDTAALINRVGRWTASGAPTYAAATAAERAVSGFWCDTTGAPSGFDGSRYW
jgi:hypothetical protein